MTLRRAIPGDEPAIEAFLATYAESSMFLRSNLAEWGLTGTGGPNATTYWIGDDAGGIGSVFGCSQAGYLMAQAPDATTADWRHFTANLAGREIAGMTGPADQVDAAMAAMGFAKADFALNRAEPLYRLALDRLILPPGPGSLRLPRQSDRDLLTDWYLDYESGALGAPDTEATRGRVAERVDRIIAGDRTRILEVDGTPVSVTAFNARLPDMVQIGGVYTPPERRAQGHARRAVALHLGHARTGGVITAILFAASPPACRAYEAIGFERIGSYRLALLGEKRRLPG